VREAVKQANKLLGKFVDILFCECGMNFVLVKICKYGMY
jgi:hypothetical protein